MKSTHLVYCPFTGLGLHNGYRGLDWLENRIKIFRQFVVPSLLNQTNKDFVLWISWRLEEKENALVWNFHEMLRRTEGLNFKFTFGGLCFWDDKYPDDIAEQRLKESLRNTLPELKDTIGDSELVYMTIQPSDDMYLSNAFEEIRKYITPGAFGWSKGYIMRFATKELAEYNPETRPPFYTKLFKAEDFLDPDKHYNLYHYKSHEYVPYTEPPMQGRMFCVGTHGENISTVFNHPYKGREIISLEKEDILIKLGVWQVDSLEVKKQGLRLWSRIILNKLPFQKGIRKLYHSLPNKFKKL